MVDNRGSTQCPKSPTGAHHWMIPEPAGTTSKGVCKYCGAVEEFWNSISSRNRPLSVKPSKFMVGEVA
jgi:hypothetical protein